MRIAAIISASIALAQSMLAAPDTSAPVTSMESITPYQQGIQALADHLPELAVTRFEEAYKVPNLTDAQNREILYRLTEAQVRSNLPDKALVTLNSKFFKDHPEREFWLAQSYAAQGKLLDAIDHFKKLDQKSHYIDDATLSLASLQLALGFTEEAISNYLKANKSKKQKTKLKSAAALAEIYIENDNLQKAKQMIDSLPASGRAESLKAVLDAQLALAGNNYTDAIELYSGLFNGEQFLPPRLYQIALIGLADARFAAGQTQEAILGLTHFINNHHDSSLLLPIFERLNEWAPQPISATSQFYLQLQKWAERGTDAPANYSYKLTSDFIVNPLPASVSLSSTGPYLRAIAHYYYAKQTSQLETPGSLNKAQFEFSAFRLAYPRHPLFGASIFDTAKIQLKLNQRVNALYTLQALAALADKKEIIIAPEAKAQAGFIAGTLSVEAADYTDALKAFTIASKSNNQYLVEAASINVGLAALRSADLAAFDAQKEKITDKELSTQLSVEKALWLAHQKHPEAREALNSFLLKHPDNQRAVDARIALAAICVSQPPLDPILSKALLDTVDNSELSAEQFTDYTRTSYLLAELKQEWPAAISALDSYLEKFPESSNKVEFSMRKGLALYRNGEHNKARQLLGKIAMANPDSPLTTFCHYYAGMAARLEGTPSALKDSVNLFEKVMATKSPLAIEARIQQARVLLDINRTEEAKISLNQVYNAQSNSPQQREIGILLASALHTQGSEAPGQYAKAVAIYDQLLASKNLPLSWSNQIHYMKGQTLESMEQPTLALDSYYHVINKENVAPQATAQQEWKWFYQCSFKAIALLETQQDYRAAVSIAKKVASYGGPESEAYQKRARALEMQHMIWEE